MKQDAHHSFDAFVTRLRNSEPETFLSVEELASFLEPFLLNPEAHHEHVKMILHVAYDAGVMEMGKPLLRFYDHPPLRWIIPLRSRVNQKVRAFADSVEQLGPQLKATVQPVALDLDILPPLALETDPSYKAIGMTAIAVQVKTSVRPNEAYSVNRASLDLRVHQPTEAHVIAAQPQSEYEVLGDRQRDVSVAHKEVLKQTIEGGIKSSAKLPGYEGTLTVSAKESDDREYATSIAESLKDRPVIPKVVCSDVGSGVHWDLYQTPTWAPVGGITFRAEFIVPRGCSSATMDAQLTVHLTGWGPAELRIRRTVSMVMKE